MPLGTFSHLRRFNLAHCTRALPHPAYTFIRTLESCSMREHFVIFIIASPLALKAKIKLCGPQHVGTISPHPPSAQVESWFEQQIPTGHQPPATSHKPPATSQQPPPPQPPAGAAAAAAASAAASNSKQQQAASCRQQAASSKQQAATSSPAQQKTCSKFFSGFRCALLRYIYIFRNLLI